MNMGRIDMCSGLSKKDDITILVNSCDLYEDAWYPFFKLLQIQWKDCPYDVVLHTETKVYDCDFMDVRTICTGKEMLFYRLIVSTSYSS